jgi:hypothetical protein
MSHTHTHSHDYSARKHPEFVVLDIGDEVGALIVHCDADMHGIEVEISPAHQDELRRHKQVLERRLGDRPAFSLVFDGLTAGTYTLWVDGEARARDVRIEGGSVAQLDWRTAGAAS